MRRIFKSKNLKLLVGVVVAVLALVACLSDANEWAKIATAGLNILVAVFLCVESFSVEFTNERYYEQVGKFMFDKLSNNIGEFTDFLIAEGIEKEAVKEREKINKIFNEIAGNHGSYEEKRKLVRALPYLYDIDKREAVYLLKTLRYEECTSQFKDIRRRAVDSALMIVERGGRLGKYLRYARVRKYLYISGDSRDDIHCAISLAEALMYMKVSFFWGKSGHIERRIKALEDYISENSEKYNTDKNCTVEIDEAFEILNGIRNATDEKRKEEKAKLTDLLSKKDYATILYIVRNLCITCPGYPDCVESGECGRNARPDYILDRIYNWLGPNAFDKRVDLVRPLVKHFNCAYNNLDSTPEREPLAKMAMKRFFSNYDYLINRTAFDKFGLILELNDREYVKKVINSAIKSTDAKIEKIQKSQNELFKTMDSEQKLFFYKSRTDNSIKYNESKDTHNVIERLTALKETQDPRYQMNMLIEECKELQRFKNEIEKIKENY